MKTGIATVSISGNLEEKIEAIAEAGFDADQTRAMLTEVAVEINRSGQLVKVSDVERALRDPSYGRYDDVPIAHDVGGELLDRKSVV